MQMKQSFLNRVADELISRFGWDGLKNLTLVFPMHRAGVVMRSILQERMRTEHMLVLWAPEMITLGDLFDNMCPLGKEDELFTVCRLHRIYSAYVQDAPMEIDRFYGWGRQLLSDFSNIDQGIPEQEIQSFFRNAQTLSDLDTYKLDDEVRHRLEDLLYKGEARRQSLIADSVQAHFAALWKALPDIYHRLRDELSQVGKGYEGQRMRYVVTHWEELKSITSGKTYCFIGFNYLLLVERQLMQLLQKNGQALFFWDYVEDFRTNSKAFAFIRQNMQQLPNALPPMQWGEPHYVRTISVTSVHSEAEYAGRWMLQAYKKKGESTAIVICDETQLEPVIYSLPLIRLQSSDQPEDINITKGFPLRNTAIYPQVIRQLDANMHRAGDLVQALQNTVDFVDEQSALSMEAQQNTWQWHLGREALYQIRRTLIQFMHIMHDDLVSEVIERPELLRRLICRHMEQQMLPFHGEPITDLQIMGVLETRALDFDHLLLMNVEEGVIPAHQADKSFLPYYLRKAYGLQTHDERASVYAYNFFRLLHRAGDVTILFSQSQTSMTKKTMSRFVMQMLISPDEFVVDKCVLTESNTLQSIQTIEVPEDTSWVQACRQEGKSLYLSPSAINTYYACRRKFYLEYIRGLREEDEPETIFSNRTLGLFVHEAIHYLYEEYCHCDNKNAVRIYPNQVEAINTPERRKEAVCMAYERLNALYINRHPCVAPIYRVEQHELENRVIDAYIEHILLRDRHDAEHKGLTILMLENAQYTAVEIPIKNSDETVTIQVGGRLDRMDRVGGLNTTLETTRIVDYKCGKYSPLKMNAKSEDLRLYDKSDADYVRQTLVYGFVSYSQGKVHSVEPHLYFTSQDLTDEKTQTRVAIDRSPVIYDASTHEQYDSLVRDMLQDIVSEREFEQCAECSPYCPFLLLCGRQTTPYMH